MFNFFFFLLVFKARASFGDQEGSAAGRRPGKVKPPARVLLAHTPASPKNSRITIINNNKYVYHPQSCPRARG